MHAYHQAEEYVQTTLEMDLAHIIRQTAGLTLAAKLSENPQRSVLVLEAGGANIGDPLLCTSSPSS